MAHSARFILTVCLVAALALCVSSLPNIDKALEAQRQLVASRPGDASAHNDLANLLALAGQEEEALAAYQRALELAPDQSAPRFNMALLLQQVGRARDAITELERVIEQSPDDAWAYYQLGVIYHGKGQRSRALESYARAFAVDTSLTFARVNPHIIENRLFTEALLLSNKYRTPLGAQAPRQYEDGARIVELILEREGEGEMAGNEAGDEDEMGAPVPAGQGRGMRTGGDEKEAPSSTLPSRGGEMLERGRNGDDDDDEDEGGGRVITASSLETGSSVGRVKSSGGAGARPAPGRGGRNSVRRYTPPNRGAKTEASGRARPPAAGGSPFVGSGQAVPRPRNIGPRYLPGRASTGRLDMKLLPVAEEGMRLAARDS